jgi:hypothetical protein
VDIRVDYTIEVEEYVIVNVRDADKERVLRGHQSGFEKDKLVV